MNGGIVFDSMDVAAYIARLCTDGGYSYNNTKIQKLLYCCYGVSLARGLGRICSEYPRAWPYGPAFPKVFSYIKKHGDPIAYSDSFAKDASDAQKKVAEDVVYAFAKYTAGALTEWSHMRGSPWDKVVNGDDPELERMAGKPWNSFIPDEYISDYFKEHIMESEKVCANG